MSALECTVCHRRCRLESGQDGFCHARANISGALKCINYGMLTSIALDPIEKKPLRRFRPGSKILSVGSYGCNLRCPFCQNFQISMANSGTYKLEYVSPEALVAQAEQLVPRGNIGLAFTYNEPLVSWEYIRDCGKLAHKAGLVNVVVSNGCASLWVARALAGIIDAWNIDLKGFTSAWYKRLGGDLTTVQNFIAEAAKSSHVELTTLIVPRCNDTEAEMELLSDWVARVPGENTALHVSRFFPRYDMLDRDATPAEKVYALAAVARRHLKFVYTCNC